MAKTVRPEFNLYNTWTRQKDVFKPINEGKVGMYVCCGVTLYNLSHIGHARTYVAFDVLYRYLKYLGYEVVYVHNFTVLDDKIMRRLIEEWEDPIALIDRFSKEYLKDMADLQCLPPTHQPHFNDHMEQITDMIFQIINNGYAYVVDGDVYLCVDNCPYYGILSGRQLKDDRVGKRVAGDERKRNPADFALWKAAKPFEPQWDSPWGPGRPGCHIGCSAMSTEYLTNAFDIHGGVMDLIFPHHEHEIAQNSAAGSFSMDNYWMHIGTANTHDKYMSEERGNLVTIREVTELYHPLALRHFLMGTHYRSPVNYSFAKMDIASEAVFDIYQTLQDVEEAWSRLKEKSEASQEPVHVSSDAQKCISKLRTEFETKLADDLHTPSILNSALQEALAFMHKFLNKLKMQKKAEKLSTVKSLDNVHKEVKKVLEVHGLLSSSSYPEVVQQLKEKALKRAELTEEDVLHSIEKRTLAKNNREFSTSDEIRADLAAKGIALMDMGKETSWWPCVPVQQDGL